MTCGCRNPREEIRGWKAIADRLTVSVATAERYAQFEEDPLPVLKSRTGRVLMMASALEAWQARNPLPAHVHREQRKLRHEGKRGNMRERPRKPLKLHENKSVN